MREAIGVYIHVPFCASKCPYCDFYSRKANDFEVNKYMEAMEKNIFSLSQKYPRKADTVYFGGGTPSVLGGENLSKLLLWTKLFFPLEKGAEITAEVNPESATQELFDSLIKSGFNRISMGLQSANEEELELLGRRHSLNQVKNAVQMARNAGFNNISLDLMIGLLNQTEEKLKNSIDFCSQLNVEHISSYILKIEENTVFGKKNQQTADEDTAGDLYLYSVEYLKKKGYNQYEISNFSKAGFESKHNLKYWQLEEYLGIGPSAHSFMEGKRFYYPRGLKGFCENPQLISDGTGGDLEELIMLRLRLNEGITRACLIDYEDDMFNKLIKRARVLPKNLINVDDNRISLSAQGMLVSNSVIEFVLNI